MPDVPQFPPDFPDLPARLQQIAGSDYRRWKKEMADWIQRNQTVTSQFTNTSIERFFETIVQSDKVFLPKYCSVGLFDPNDGYESSINGETTILQQFGKLLAIERSYPGYGTIQTGNTLFVEPGSTITGRAYLFLPPDDFWLPVVVKGIFPVRYPHFGHLPPPFNRDCIRTDFNTRMLERGDFAGLGDGGNGITQFWWPGYFKFGGNRIWIHSNRESDWTAKPIAHINIGVNEFDVFDGNWFDLNVNGSSWQGLQALRGFEFNSFPVNNFDPVPGGGFTAVPQWQDV